MDIVCLDLEGVLIPEIWINFAIKTGLNELKITTRDEPDYDKLMNYRIEILEREGLGLPDIQAVIGSMDPLPGATAFAGKLREHYQLIILSDTFVQFAKPLMRKLEWPTLFCNSLEINSTGKITGYKLRQDNGKFHAVKNLQAMNFSVFAAGDSYNDLSMIKQADAGAFFCPPESIVAENPQIPVATDYDKLWELLENSGK